MGCSWTTQLSLKHTQSTWCRSGRQRQTSFTPEFHARSLQRELSTCPKKGLAEAPVKTGDDDCFFMQVVLVTTALVPVTFKRRVVANKARGFHGPFVCRGAEEEGRATHTMSARVSCRANLSLDLLPRVSTQKAPSRRRDFGTRSNH